MHSICSSIRVVKLACIVLSCFQVTFCKPDPNSLYNCLVFALSCVSLVQMGTNILYRIFIWYHYLCLYFYAIAILQLFETSLQFSFNSISFFIIIFTMAIVVKFGFVSEYPLKYLLNPYRLSSDSDGVVHQRIISV